MKSKIIELLRPLVASKGLNKEELESLAEIGAKNLTAESTAEEIESVTQSLVPYADLMQRVGNRLVSATEKKYEGWVKPDPKPTTTADTKPQEKPKQAEEPSKGITAEEIKKMVAEAVAGSLQPFKNEQEQKRLNSLLRSHDKVKGLPITDAFMRGYKVEKEEDIESIATQIEKDFLEQQQALINSKRVAAPPMGNENGLGETDDLIEQMKNMTKAAK